jgi:hypothetical protein
LSYRSCLGKKEKEVALVKHELKEAQRKAEQDQEARKKAESERAEIRRKLEDETNRRTKEQNNHVQVRLLLDFCQQPIFICPVFNITLSHH